MESWDRITQSSSRIPRCITQKFGKERVHRRESRCINVYLRNELRGLQVRGKNARRNPKTGAVRPRSSLGTGKGCLQAHKGAKIHSTLLPMPPMSTNPEERDFVIDSRTSMHPQSKKDLSSGNPCKKKKTSQETERSLRKFLEQSERPKFKYTDKSLEFWQILCGQHTYLISRRRTFFSCAHHSARITR